jgi:hypothetical protein
MVSEKSLYWISVGLLALVVTNNFATRQEVVSRVSDTATAFAQRAVERAMRYAAAVEVAFSPKPECPRAELAMARAQAKLVRVQTAVICDRAALMRLQSDKAQLMALRELKSATVSLNRNNFKIDVPAISVDASY